nr:UbiA family prenyltransferase [Tenacibaculum mesophilum]
MNDTFLNIIQWKKIIYFIFILFLFKYSFLYGYGFETTLSFFDLGLLSISSAFLLASGYLTSFFFRNKQKKTRLPLNKIKKVSILLMIFGILVGLIVSLKVNKIWYGLIFIICPIVVHLYSKNNIQKTFFSNIVTSFLKPFALLMLWWFDFPLNLSIEQWELFYNLQLITIGYVIISFLSNMVIEIIIDIINVNHDNINKQNTLPVLLGRKRAKDIALMLSFIACLFVFSVAVAFLKNKFIFSTIILLGILPELYFIYKLMLASESKDYNNLLKISYISFFLALLSVPTISYYIKYVIS